jgi:hypothetical protein
VLKHLRYLNLIKTSISELPGSVCALYHLQLLQLNHKVKSLPDKICNLSKLQHIEGYQELTYDLFEKALPQIPYIGKLTLLQHVEEFCVQKVKGCELRQLRDLNELSGNLSVKNLENVTGKDEALESNLDQKIHIGSLKLVWSDGINADGSLQLEILEGLKPPSKLKSLEIKGFKSAKYPSWLVEGSHFESLESFKLANCSALEDLPLSTELFKYCSKLLLNNVSTLRTLFCLPAALTKLRIKSCPLLMFITIDELEQHDQRADIMRTDYLASQLASLWEVDSGKDIREVISSEHSSLKQLMTLMDADISHLQTIASVLDRENDATMLKEDIINAWMFHLWKEHRAASVPAIRTLSTCPFFMQYYRRGISCMPWWSYFTEEFVLRGDHDFNCTSVARCSPKFGKA